MVETTQESNMVKKKKPTSFWVATILGILLLLSALVNFILLITLAITFSPSEVSDELSRYNEVFVTGSPKATNKILRISVSGVLYEGEEIFGGHYDTVKLVINSLKKAKSDNDIKAVIFHINSPGGGITECDQIYNEILRFKESRPNVPIIVSMDKVAASGGYYISTLADKIIARPTTITGSIGVIAHLINVEGLSEKIGLKSEVIKSGDKKDLGSAWRKMTAEERAIFQEIINEMYQRFVKIVVDGRKNLNRETVLKLADGRIYTGEQALKNGLIDELGDFEDSIKSAKKLANLSEARVVEYKKKKGFLEELFGAKSTAQFDLVSNFNRLLLQRNTPQLLYLWTVE